MTPEKEGLTPEELAGIRASAGVAAEEGGFPWYRQFGKDVLALLSEVERLRAENERLRELSGDPDDWTDREKDRADKAEKQLATYREALERYGRHEVECPADWEASDSPSCTCGFSKVARETLNQEEKT